MKLFSEFYFLYFNVQSVSKKFITQDEYHRAFFTNSSCVQYVATHLKYVWYNIAKCTKDGYSLEFVKTLN